jgi:HPt (histidine-containing phosphotransfer) domain-containing protein
LKNEDASEVARAAHSLKGLAANFEAIDCRDSAATIEQLSRGGDLSRVKAKLRMLKQNVSNLVVELQKSR